MQKLLLLTTTASFLFGGCYTQLKSDGDYWGYTGKSKRDKVVVIEERTDTVIVTSQDTIVTDPTFIEPEPERTVIINNYYPDYSIYSVSPFAYRHWYPGPHVSFSISFGAPYHHHDYFYDHYRPYWSWWDRPWYYDPYYYHPYYAWHSPYYDPWWGWYDPYTCLRPSYYPWWYYDNHYNWHHHNYTYDNNDYRGNRRRGRIGGEDRAGNSNTTGGGSNRGGKTVTSTKAAAPVGKAVQVRKDPGVQIITDNTEGVRTAVPTNESQVDANSESTTTEKTKIRTVTAPNDFPAKDEVVLRGSSHSTSSTPTKKVVVKSVAPANKTASPSVSSSSSKRSANHSAPASESTKPSRSSSDNSGSSKSSGSTTSGSSYSKPSAPSSSGSYSGSRSSSSSGSSSGGSNSGGRSSGGSSSSSSGSNSSGGRASRSSR